MDFIFCYSVKLEGMALHMIVQGYQNKHFMRDFFIDPMTLGKRFHDGLTILKFVFN